jgi:hypothetical protein
MGKGESKRKDQLSFDRCDTEDRKAKGMRVRTSVEAVAAAAVAGGVVEILLGPTNPADALLPYAQESKRNRSGSRSHPSSSKVTDSLLYGLLLNLDEPSLLLDSNSLDLLEVAQRGLELARKLLLKDLALLRDQRRWRREEDSLVKVGSR